MRRPLWDFGLQCCKCLSVSTILPMSLDLSGAASFSMAAGALRYGGAERQESTACTNMLPRNQSSSIALFWRLSNGKPWPAGLCAKPHHPVACWLVFPSFSFFFPSVQLYAGLCLCVGPKLLLPHCCWVQVCVQGASIFRGTPTSVGC